MKGKAAGWQSTLAKLRIEESVQCFSKAIDYAVDEKKDEIKEQAANEISNLSKALVSLTCNNFIRYQSKDNVNDILNSATKTKEFALKMLIKCDKSVSNYEIEIATLINNAAMEAWNNTIRPEYDTDNNGHPSHHAFITLLEKESFCKTLIKYAIEFADNDENNDAIRYKNLIDINDFCMDACSWKQTYGYETEGQAFVGGLVGGGQHWYWAKEYTLNENAKSSRRSDNQKYREKIEICNKQWSKRVFEEKCKAEEEQKERNEKYWAEHAEEKQKLDSELKTLQDELKQLESQIAPYDNELRGLKTNRDSAVPSENEKNKMLDEISRLRKEQKGLGMFKGKEKKALQAQIDELNSRIFAINESIDKEKKEQQMECDKKIKEVEERAKPIKDKITSVQKRINEINTELTKNR